MALLNYLYSKHYYFIAFILLAACATSQEETSSPQEDFCEKIHRNNSISLTAELAGVADLMKEKTGVVVLEDGAGSMVARAWLTEYAEKSIDIQYFIFSTDNVGLIACDYLVRAADRGVKIRILVDDIMVDASLEDVLIMDSHKNSEIKIYNPGVNLGKSIFSKIKTFTTEFRSANQRMHNKTFIVDGKVVITGGRNIANEYFDYDHEYNFRDRDVLLLGKVAGDVNKSFIDFWQSDLSVAVLDLAKEVPDGIPDPARYDRLHLYACNPENFWPQVRTQIENLPSTFATLKSSGRLVWVDSVTFVSDAPGKNDGSQGLGGGGLSTDALIGLLKTAKHSIDIQTPYLITTDLSRNLFKAATDRGVKIRILTNSLASTDNAEAFSVYQRDRKELLATGVRVFEFRPDAAERHKMMTSALQEEIDFTPIFGLHAKSMVIDGTTTVIGTFNLDPRSANLNTECVTIIYSEQIANSVLEGMDIEFNPENSWETTLTSNPDEVASKGKQIRSWVTKVVPKGVL